ncbi:hypothetical protein Molly5_129 [Maribacter phage Molly_5]|uniref:Uncharacterized protein n=1 Tax=Maribacter phage Molly_1 TaxID=2745685 RepID=A0A8E4UY97_9CAUD|nr:hypothetical protein M1M29_gp128 [Maribacter phage Molly_1]QQO97620.1 hypothetical protein Molly2_128 [Maribacter phage Molly_2]QQO97820.1 hypothetical protein Molly3_128 [Maribacter phage Molly_3]QQO98021.1 hypothetical protein Molly4_129 [Maribacter phage Molly_4]QQO98221.1 hypothetical protein Molly5_129 [Maribacter phage Molly_5]QQO97420.1 hypothetical protein Molly1_128 [Maribacter phage Molly_1]
MRRPELVSKIKTRLSLLHLLPEDLLQSLEILWSSESKKFKSYIEADSKNQKGRCAEISISPYDAEFTADSIDDYPTIDLYSILNILNPFIINQRQLSYSYYTNLDGSTFNAMYQYLRNRLAGRAEVLAGTHNIKISTRFNREILHGMIRDFNKQHKLPNHYNLERI